MSTQMKKAGKVYTWRMMITSILYSATVVGINLVDNAYALPQCQRIGLALLPLIPALMMFATILAFFRQMDEVWQRIITESTLISAGIVGLGCFTYGFLQGAVDLPMISLIWVLPALIAFQGIAMIFVRLRYQ
jgi:hypothetical protein